MKKSIIVFLVFLYFGYCIFYIFRDDSDEFDLHTINCEQILPIEVSSEIYNSQDYLPPTNLYHAIMELDSALNQNSKEKIIQSNKFCMSSLHFGFGMFLRNKWGLWNRDSKLYQQFHKSGITHPDNVSGIILRTYWTYLKTGKIDLAYEIKSSERAIRNWKSQKKSRIE